MDSELAGSVLKTIGKIVLAVCFLLGVIAGCIVTKLF